MITMTSRFRNCAAVGIVGGLLLCGDGPRGLAEIERQPASQISIRPFEIDTSQDILTDLRERLARARMPDEPEDVGWDLGMNQAYLTPLIEYCRHDFDWRAQERRLNAVDHFTT